MTLPLLAISQSKPPTDLDNTDFPFRQTSAVFDHSFSTSTVLDDSLNTSAVLDNSSSKFDVLRSALVDSLKHIVAQ
jgi:hypothetical protein